MSLFLKECKNILKSYIYYVFIAVVVLFYISQMGMAVPKDLEKMFSPPKEISIEEVYAPYGERKSEPSKAMIPKVSAELYREYKDNSYGTYPVGIYKKVKLNIDETKKIELVLEEITGRTIKELDEMWDSNKSSEPLHNQNITFERFQELMINTDEILGGGSDYGESFIGRFARVPITYEEAMEDYEYTINKDRLTSFYARLFCDYIGIIIGIFPIFVAVFMSIKDKKTKMYGLVYSRNTSSLKLIFSRYFALVFMMIIPVMALGIKETIVFILYANSNNLSIDMFAFIKYIIWWIMPTLMMVTSMGMFLTILTDTPLVILAGLFTWFFNLSHIKLSGDYPLMGLFIRHNIGRGGALAGALIEENLIKIMANRLLITGISLFIVVATSYIYEKKRSGKLDIGTKVGKSFRFSKSKYKTSHTK